MARVAEKRRTTRETDVAVKIDLDGRGTSTVATGIGFLDHMLDLFARHGLFDLEVTCAGDLQIDGHHSVEDIAITLGQAFAEALGDKSGIERYGVAYVPMDEALARAVVDLSGRAFFVYRVANTRQRYWMNAHRAGDIVQCEMFEIARLNQFMGLTQPALRLT